MDKAISKEIIEYYQSEAEEPRLIDLPRVKELVREAWLAGCMKGGDWSTEAQEQRALDKYMKALEAKHATNNS